MKKIVIAIIITLVLLAGCADNDQQNQEQQNANQGEGSGSGTNMNANETSGSAEDAFSMFRDLLGKKGEWKAEYDMTTKTQGTEQKVATTMYYKGERQRMDFSSPEANTKIWVTPEKVVSCVDEGSENCFVMDAYDSASYIIEGNEIETNRQNYTVTSLPGRTIAGEQAKCFKVIYRGEYDSETDYCTTGDGIMLYTKGSAEGAEWEMKAKSVSRSVTDAEMTPPEAQSIEDMYGMPEGFDPSQYQ